MPGLYVNDGGTWKEVTTIAPQVNDAGTWKNIIEAWCNDAGTWKKVWPNLVAQTPTNLRFGTRVWANNRYEVQVIWDPIVDGTTYDKYQLEVTRTGGSASAASAVVVDFSPGTNSWNDIYCGTTGGAVLTYRVRSSLNGVPSAWSAAITTTTPGDAGFMYTNGINVVGDVYGNMYIQCVHDGNPNNVYYDLYRQQTGYYDWTYIRRYSIVTQTQNITDNISGHYRGPYAGSVNTQNAWPETVTWTVWTVNAWGKGNNQGSGNPYPANWSPYPNGASWKLTAPGDRYLRLNAIGTNVYRRQPSNSVGWVGGLVRCGGLQGDMEGCWFWDKSFLTDWGFRARINAGNQVVFGIGRSTTDGGNLNCTFTIGFVAMAWGSSADPRPITSGLTTATWQRGQGANFNMPPAYMNAWTNPGNPDGATCVYSGNTAGQYAEFGSIGEIVGGTVNGQIVIASPYG